MIGSLLQVYRIFLPVRLKRFKPNREEDPAYLKQTSDQNEGSEGSIAPALRLDFDDGSLDRMILLSTNDCLYCRGNPAAPNGLIIPHGTRQEADLFAR